MRYLSCLRLCTLVACVLAGGAINASAQTTGVLVGRVVEQGTDEPLPGANVMVEDTQIRAATDVDGYYRIENIPPGTYAVVAAFVGFDLRRAHPVQIRAGETTTSHFALELAPPDICGVFWCPVRVPLFSRDPYTSRVVLGEDPAHRYCSEGTIDLQSLAVGR